MRGSTASAMCSELSDVVTEVVTEVVTDVVTDVGRHAWVYGLSDVRRW
mgnify:CR=1 FL=1